MRTSPASGVSQASMPAQASMAETRVAKSAAFCSASSNSRDSVTQALRPSAPSGAKLTETCGS